MKVFRAAACIVAAALPAVCQQQAATRQVTDDEVRRVHAATILTDLHNDFPIFILDNDARIGDPHPELQTDLARLRAGGVGAVFFSAYVRPKYGGTGQSAHRAMMKIDAIRTDIVDRNFNQFQLALTADDILQAHRDFKIAVLIGIEGGHAIEDSLRLLRDYYRLGVRYMTLTHANTNDWADSSGDIDDPTVQHHGGLTDFGRGVVTEMNRLGMMVDVSHVADDTFWDVMETSKAPVIASHSGSRAISNVPRNLTDEMVTAIAKTGGMVGVNFNCDFVSQAAADGTGKATIDDVVATIDHMVKLVGVDYVGIGSDFDGIDCAPEGLKDVSQFPNLTRKLLEHGYTGDDIAKIYGGNLIRVMRAVQAPR